MEIWSRYGDIREKQCLTPLIVPIALPQAADVWDKEMMRQINKDKIVALTGKICAIVALAIIMSWWLNDYEFPVHNKGLRIFLKVFLSATVICLSPGYVRDMKRAIPTKLLFWIWIVLITGLTFAGLAYIWIES